MVRWAFELNEQQIKKIIVYSIAGKQVQEISTNGAATSSIQEINSLEKGVYLLNILGDSMTIWKKVIVE